MSTEEERKQLVTLILANTNEQKHVLEAKTDAELRILAQIIQSSKRSSGFRENSFAVNSNKTIVLTMLFLFTFNFVKSQDIHFSQFWMAPQVQNPALCGIENDLQAILNYRLQWKSISEPFRTSAASVDAKLNDPKKSNGFFSGGLSFYSDKSGDSRLNTSLANLSLAYHVNTGDYHTRGLGFMSGYYQTSISNAGLQWAEQYNGMTYDATLPTGESLESKTFNFMDFGTGILWNYNNTSGRRRVTDNHDFKANVGFSLFHPQRSKYSYLGNTERLSMKYVVHAKLLVSLNGNNIALCPEFMYYRQGGAQEIYAGSLVRFKLIQASKFTGYHKSTALLLGAFVRVGDAIVFPLLFDYSNFSFGASYDLNLSKLTSATNSLGGWEISVRYSISDRFSVYKTFF